LNLGFFKKDPVFLAGFPGGRNKGSDKRKDNERRKEGTNGRKEQKGRTEGTEGRNRRKEGMK
jgi:hypothetical protein